MTNCSGGPLSADSVTQEIAVAGFGRPGAPRVGEVAYMSRRLVSHTFAAAVIAIVLGTTNGLASGADQPQYLGKSLNYWVKVIHDRNEEMISLAFDAIRMLGSEARAAVPDLIELVEAPFTPVRIGTDSHKVIASKVYDIELRAAAIDALAAIGESASSATMPLVRWALTPRVVPDAIKTADDEELFVELVMMDTGQRMRVAGAITEFGPDASPVIAGLLSSSDTPKRKLGVAILSEGALPIATELLRSQKCEDRTLGLTILKDMDLVVAKPYLEWLQTRIVCDAN